MFHIRGNVTNRRRNYGRRQIGNGIALFWTVLFVLSTTLTANQAWSQGSGNSGGGTLGGLLNQLQTLQGTGAIDALEGRGPSNLNGSRGGSSDKPTVGPGDPRSSKFLRAQRSVERRHEQDRELLLAHARHRASQLEQLGQNPWLDAAQD